MKKLLFTGIVFALLLLLCPLLTQAQEPPLVTVIRLLFNLANGSRRQSTTCVPGRIYVINGQQFKCLATPQGATATSTVPLTSSNAPRYSTPNTQIHNLNSYCFKFARAGHVAQIWTEAPSKRVIAFTLREKRHADVQFVTPDFAALYLRKGEVVRASGERCGPGWIVTQLQRLPSQTPPRLRRLLKP